MPNRNPLAVKLESIAHRIYEIAEPHHEESYLRFALDSLREEVLEVLDLI